MSNSCDICAEKFNRTSRFPVDCEYCNYKACRSCCETYILGEKEAKCMNRECTKEWTRKFMVQAFTRQFVNVTWKKTREKILFDKEVALLPATQVLVEAQMVREKAIEEARVIEKQIQELNRQRSELMREAYNTETQTKTVTRAFTRACPVEECRGYLSTQWKCGLCEMWTCPDCFLVKGKERDVEHTCAPDDLATAELIKKDTKPCPKCSMGIFKIEGCDQMWCTQCHTAFSWRTGHIETAVHNPHYFEYQRRNGGIARAPGDVICGREIRHDTVNQFRGFLMRNRYDPFTQESGNIYDMLERIIQSVLHLSNAQMRAYRVNNVENNQELRIQYMRNKMDKDAFQIRVQRDNKKHEKNREICEVLQMFVNTVTDILYRAYDVMSQSPTIFNARWVPGRGEDLDNERKQLEQEVLQIIMEIKPLRVYANECLAEIADVYGNRAKKLVFYRSDRVYSDVLVSAESMTMDGDVERDFDTKSPVVAPVRPGRF
jgi:hypothetical protein